MKKIQLAFAGLFLLMTGYSFALLAGSAPVSAALALLMGNGRAQYGLEIRADYTQLIAAATGLVAIAGVSLALWARSGNKRNSEPAEPAEERTAEIYWAGERRAYPKVMLQNPFGAELEYLTFEQKIDVAIEGTLQAGRYVGVIFIPVFREGGDSGDVHAKRLTIALDMIGAEIKVNMRKHDGMNIEPVGLAIAITLMKSFGNLESVSRRLQIVAALAARRLGGVVIGDAGMAAYPLDGYSAAELLQTARSRALATKPPSLNHEERRAIASPAAA
jgi:hypothetical protein